MADLPASVDAGVLEELLQALLEVAARKDALRSWPRDAPPDSQPPVQARRDDDGTLGVFRFFTIVAPSGGADGTPGRPDARPDVRPDVRPDPLREMTADDARARIDGVGELQPGDEVGVELPLGRLAAIALADVEGTRDGRPHLLPQRIVEMLGDSALAAAVAARLSSLRGPPPHVPLRRLVTDHGDDVVEWTAVCGDVVDPAERRAEERAQEDDGENRGGSDDDGGVTERAPRGELIVLVARGGDHRLVVVPTATSAAGHAALLRALAPPPAERSLWRFLEVEGPKLLCGDQADVASGSAAAGVPDGDALWSDEGPPGENARRLSLEVKSIAISRDPTVYGVARARARLLTWSGNHIIDDAEAIVGLPVDLARVVGEPWPEGAALARVVTAARAFRASLQKRLSALVDARSPTVHDVLAGAGFLRVLARAAADAKLGADATSTTVATGDDDEGAPLSPAEPPDLREVVDPPASWPEDEIALRVADVGVLVLSPADDVVRLRTFTGGVEEVTDLFVDGALVDGDDDAWRAFTDVFAQAIADAEVDVELAFPVDAAEGAEESDEVETVMLSAWLLSLGEPTDARPNRWPPHARAAESAAALQLLIDRFVDAGPPLPRDGARDGGRRR